MSQPEVQKTKKRKHAAAVEEGAGGAIEPSTKRSKKEKAKDAGGSGGVKLHKKAKQDKGKARATDDAFRVVRASISMAVSPVFAADIRGGVEEMLDSMLMRYIPAVEGVVLAHDRLEYLDSVATIKADCPYSNCRVAFDATVWSPQVGMKLAGKINLCSPDHISLLVHRTFNVSIPRHHITTDTYEFEYGPAENDPEFGAGQDAASEGAAEEENGEEHVDSGGRWIHKTFGTKLGDADGSLEFTVVGLTVANQMLSLVGSIQPDPFSPEHVPTAHVTTATSRTTLSQAPSAPLSEREVDAMIENAEDEDSDEDMDPFERLGKKGDEMERRAREAQEEEKRKEKKRKRKESKAQEGDAVDAAPKKSGKKKRAS